MKLLECNLEPNALHLDKRLASQLQHRGATVPVEGSYTGYGLSSGVSLYLLSSAESLSSLRGVQYLKPTKL